MDGDQFTGRGAAPEVERALTHGIVAGGLRITARGDVGPDDFRALINAAAEQSRESREALAVFVREVL